MPEYKIIVKNHKILKCALNVDINIVITWKKWYTKKVSVKLRIRRQLWNLMISTLRRSIRRLNSNA